MLPFALHGYQTFVHTSTGGNPVLFGVWDGSCAPFLGRDSFFENSSRIRVGRSGMDPGAFRLVESYRGKEIGCHESWAAISEKNEKCV